MALRTGTRAASTGDGTPRTDALLYDAQLLYRSARYSDLLDLLTRSPVPAASELSVRLHMLAGMAHFDRGQVTEAIADLDRAVAESSGLGTAVRFSAEFARFLRLSAFADPETIMLDISRLRQLAAQAGDGDSLVSMHLAVARVEGCRGHCIGARRHLRIARGLIGQSSNVALACLVDVAEASLEAIAGNLGRTRELALACLARAHSSEFVTYQVSALANLAVVALYADRLTRARTLIEAALERATQITYARLGVLDTLAQLELREGHLGRCEAVLARCAASAAGDTLPARSWYDLAHQVTRCAYFEQLHDWDTIIRVADEADPELRRRQYRAVHTALLCAKARALARLGRHHDAGAALATAVRTCPRGAVDPLIVLEASKALCASLRGDTALGAVHYDRALAACRAIGYRHHEWWIAAQRDELASRVPAAAPAPARADLVRTALLMNDVVTLLGAGHSIDLLSQRLAAILQATPLGPRVEIVNERADAYQFEPSFESHAAPDGTWTLRLEGSDRRATITVRGVASIDEISLVKGLADLVQVAVARTADADREDEDLTVWPRGDAVEGDDFVFRSPRMVELVRIAERIAATNLPVLITGETGTGKEVLARFIHDRSAHKRGPFVPFNCSAVARDLVESQLFGHRRGAFTGAVEASTGVIRAAERGTVFLDEIGDLDPAVQPKLLRFMESSEIHPVGDPRPLRVTVRIVAATNANLEALARQGRFRSDLFYRTGVVKLELPPLRERKDEIPAFAALFLRRFARECGRVHLTLADDLIAALLLYDWPGNIRQLANEMRRVTALATDGQTLGAADLDSEITRNWNARPELPVSRTAPVVDIRLDQPLARATAELERKFIEHALDTSSGRVADAADMLGVSRKGLFLKRRRAGLA